MLLFLEQFVLILVNFQQSLEEVKMICTLFKQLPVSDGAEESFYVLQTEFKSTCGDLETILAELRREPSVVYRGQLDGSLVVPQADSKVRLTFFTGISEEEFRRVMLSF